MKTQLENERLQNAEGKKKIKVYVENLTNENKSLMEQKNVLETNLHDITAEKYRIEESLGQLQSTLQHTIQQVIIIIIFYYFFNWILKNFFN
jgi:hypothetical protein